MPMMLYKDLHTRLARYAIIAREGWLETTYLQKKQFSFDNYTVEYPVRPRSVLKKSKKPKIKRFPSQAVMQKPKIKSSTRINPKRIIGVCMSCTQSVIALPASHVPPPSMGLSYNSHKIKDPHNIFIESIV
jgi:hypothetical protein